MWQAKVWRCISEDIKWCVRSYISEFWDGPATALYMVLLDRNESSTFADSAQADIWSSLQLLITMTLHISVFFILSIYSYEFLEICYGTCDKKTFTYFAILWIRSVIVLQVKVLLFIRMKLKLCHFKWVQNLANWMKICFTESSSFAGT
ncbi:unnamed protein product [Vicia faba]|uniref:Uncharacterized protein n=1 Tax=Vicia faba TaxID=3906 RepID=A0AAV1BAL1_VICFA|nr:unnamed protein product [Vicia faba]